MPGMWRCDLCGFLYEDEVPPTFCPKCGTPREKFILLDEEETELMREALLVREKYTRLLALLAEALDVAQQGIALDLDEGCNKIFNRTVEEISGVHRMIKDELAGHAQQCVWAKLAGDGSL